MVPTPAGIDWGHVVSSLADWLTLAAFAITSVGLLSAFLTRGRLRSDVSTRPSSRSFTWTLSNAGASPVQQIAYRRMWITRTGRAVAGDGTEPLLQALYPGENFRLEIFDPDDVTWYGDERGDELRMPSPSRADGAVVILTWRNAVIPWRRNRRVHILMFGQPVITPRGRRERGVARDIGSIASGGEPVAIRFELAKANGGVVPVEESVQARYPREIAEIGPSELARDPLPQRVQLYLGSDLLADGQLEAYAFATPALVGDGGDVAHLPAPHEPRNFITIDGEEFDLNDSHRLRIFGR